MINLAPQLWMVFARAAVVAPAVALLVGSSLLVWWLLDHRIVDFDERSWLGRNLRLFVASFLLTIAAVMFFSVPLPLR